MADSEMKKRGGAGSSSGTSVSLVVPTYKEVLNIPELTKRVNQSLESAGISYELIFVDDNSKDGSEQAVEKLKGQGFPVSIVVRTKERGLSSAVLEGFKHAKNDILLVMDADLQHDPKYLPQLINPIADKSADFTIGSRNVAGGAVKDWPLHRRLISFGATIAARPLVKCSDPMSGFFCLSKQTLKQADTLNPLGYKIGLELMVRCGCKKVLEVPIVFQDREQGESKLTMKQNLLYLLHLLRLYVAVYPQQLLAVVLFVLLVLYLTAKRIFLA